MENKIIDHRFTIRSFHSALDYNWDTQFFFPGESHDFWEIVYVAFGAVTVTEDAQIYQLKQGDIIFHKPMEFHNILSANETTPHVLVQSFSADGTLPEKLTDGVFKLTEQERCEYEALFGKLFSFYEGNDVDPFTGMECAAELSAFLVRLSRSHTAKNRTVISSAAREYRRLINSMTNHVCDNYALDDFARENAVSISYMKILFNRFAGISPKAYYTRLRCSEAIRLLQDGLTATQVADRMRFSSPNYFSAFFKNLTGYPPSQYLKQDKAGGSPWDSAHI